MAIPKQVQEQADEADRLAAEAAGATVETQDPPAEPVAPVVPVVAQPPAPSSSVVPQTEARPVSVEEFNQLKTELEAKDQALRSLQGKYSAEVPRYAAELRALRDEISEIRKLKTPPAQPERPAHLRHVKDEEIADVDKGVLDMQGRMAQGVAEKVSENVLGELKQLRDEIQQTRNENIQTKQHAVWAEVERAHPGSLEMDSGGNAAWLDFLNTSDELTGDLHRDIGGKALASGNAQRLIRLVGKFKAQNPGVIKKTVSPAVASQVKPVPSAVEAGSNQNKPVFKESYAQQLATEHSKGLWRGREKELEKKMSEFEEAISDKRVIFGQ